MGDVLPNNNKLRLANISEVYKTKLGYAYWFGVLIYSENMYVLNFCALIIQKSYLPFPSRLFLTMQRGEKWKHWQLFVQMKDALGRAISKNMRHGIVLYFFIPNNVHV
jgi:hypothetical protein